MKFRTIFFDVDYCLLDTPTSERRIIRELYARQGQQVGDEVGIPIAKSTGSCGSIWIGAKSRANGCM